MKIGKREWGHEKHVRNVCGLRGGPDRGIRALGRAAQSVADFYRGKAIELQVNVSVGGGYDLYARMLARHWGKHIPGNPTVVPKNMEGAGGLRLANWLYSIAPQDGTAIGATGRGLRIRAVARQQGRAVRRHQIHLDRQRQR